ncbi:DUF6338 family protein [Stenotrophomonas maltophilia]|uniref:DUF6338 family protein n=1 Tax=Stenotrophomonas lactitubi TaxID=2045214 RepID=UPI0020413A4B|nr:DUF6338 family protein [Stenotrophomonas lactitubi]MCO7468698.1 DUF6338 family protein [Stenotrophomonas maltophilia]
MDNLFSQATPLLMFLLPGFLSAWIFYGLTSHPKPSQFERTVEALVFTFVVHGATKALKIGLLAAGRIQSLGVWTSDSQTIWSIIFAGLLRVGVAAAVNKDTFHSWLRGLGFTSRTSHPSEWFCVLDSNPAYVILELQDGRRLMGWPKEWPVSPTTGQFYVQQPAWIAEDATMVELTTLDGIIIHATDVRWVEVFPKETTEDDKSAKGI